MSLTISQVLGCDHVTSELAGIAFDELVRAVDDRHDELIGMGRDLEDVWEVGQARAAALEAGSGLRGELARAQPALVATGQALREFAAGIRAIANHLDQVVGEARARGMEVADDGTVHGVRIDGQAASGYARVDDPEQFAGLIRQLLAQADALDQAIERKLTANRPPNSATDPNRGAVPKESIPAAGTDPKRVHAWWDGLSDEQRRFLVAAYPQLVGNLDGVPVDSRDQANRIVLDSERDRLTADQRALDERAADIRRLVAERRWPELWDKYGENPEGELNTIAAQKAENTEKLKGVGAIADRLAVSDPTRQRAYLMGFSTADDGRAIVAIGNPDTADNVLTYVPGTGADLSNVGGNMRRADIMAADAKDQDAHAQTATVMWLGYDAPDGIPNAAAESYADGAVADLSRFQNGLRVTHEGATPSHNVVLGHSYGTTVIGHTAEQAGISADDVIFVASPGVGTMTVADLHGVPPGHVWATRAEGDPIGWVPYLDSDTNLAHGRDPVNPLFGARGFTSDPGGHSSYWYDDNRARANIARILTGQGGVD